MYNDYQSSTQDSFQYSNNSRGSSRYIPNTYYNVNSSLNTYPVNQQYLYNNTHIVQSAIQPVIQPKTPPKTLSKTELHIDYTSSWFETENGLSIHDYLRLLFTISHKHFASNCEKDTIKGIIVPHAGLRYSGLCAATAYYALRHRKKHIKRIILFCTNHSESDIFTTSAKTVNSFTGVSTSIGSIPIEIDTKIMHKLEPYTTVNNDIFEKEHSFFMQLPFIEAITPKVKLIPLIIGPIIFNKANIARIYKIFNILIDLLQDEKTVIICTSDLSHVNGHFPTKVNSYIYHSIRSKDSETLKFIYNKLNGTKGKRNMDIIQDISELNNSASCGIVAMYLFAKLLNLFSSKYIKRSSVSSSSNGSNGSKSSNGSNGSNGSKSSNSSNRSSRSSKSSRSKSTST
jgi:AmmeMemoRadiSam system protein B